MRNNAVTHDLPIEIVEIDVTSNSSEFDKLARPNHIRFALKTFFKILPLG